MEVGLLRRILKRYKQWVRLADNVKMLPEQPKPARVLSSEEKEKLVAVAASRPEWQVAHDATVLALNTTMRGCELRGLRWSDVNLFGRTLKIQRQSTKTDAGSRVLPLNQAAYAILLRRRSTAEALDDVELNHYVFPAGEHGRIQPELPMKGWRTSWRSLTKKAGLSGFRFHDLRHHAITELAEMGLSDQVIMSIAGHVSREMLEHYSHIRLEAKRQALEGLNRPSESVSEPVEEAVEARLN